MSSFLQKSALRSAIAALAGAAGLHAGQVYAAVPTYNLVWLGMGSNAGVTGSYAEDINNNNQIVGYTYDTTVTPTGPYSATLFYNWRHSAIWTPPVSVVTPWNLTEITNAEFQPCTPGVLSIGYICPDITSAAAINDSGLVVGMANVPSPTSYYLPSGSGWDHSYYFDFANNGPVLPVPTTYGVNIGHYDYSVDVNNSGTVLGFMDGSYSSSLGWSTVGYLYTPGSAQVKTLAQPVLSNGLKSDIVYTSGLSDPDANGAVTVVGYSSISTPNAQGGYNFTYRPVIWQGNTAGKEIPGFSLASTTQWSFAGEINNQGQIVGYSQDAADPSNLDYARLYNTNSQQTVTLGVGQGTHVNNAGTVTITNYQNYPVGGGFVFYPDALNSQTGKTCRLDANTVPALASASSDHIDSAKSINDNGYIVGGGTHNGLPEAYVLIPTSTPAADQTCSQTANSGSTGTTTPPVDPISFAPTLPNATQGVAYSAALSATGGVAPFTYSSWNLPTGLSINGGNIAGTPSVSGDFQVTITATDSTGASVDATVPLSVSAPAIVFKPSLPAGTQGVAYSATLSASGGVAPFTYSASGLPAGLSLSGSKVAGTPSASGSFQVALTATDSKGSTASSTVTLSISAATTSGSTTSCTVPVGAKSASDIHAKLTAVNGNQLTIGSKVVTLLDCAKITYNGTAKAPVVGYDAEANKGYVLNGVTYTTSIIIDDGK